MHPALSYPEIVGLILSNISKLHPCLFVDHVFYAEASRLLWQKCEYIHGRWLSEMVCENFDRAQFYARLVRSLTLCVDGFQAGWTEKEYLRSGASNEENEDYWHFLFTVLSFPTLQKLKISGPSIISNFNDPDIMLPHLTENLRCFTIDGIYMPSDDILRLLAARTPQLRTFRIGGRIPDQDNTYDRHDSRGELSEAGLIWYIKEARSLTKFRCTFQPVWSIHVFEAIADHPNIIEVELAPVPEPAWITGLEQTLGFPSLETIDFKTTLSALDLLIPYIPNLSRLRVHFLEEFPLDFEENGSLRLRQASILSIATLHKLKMLELYFPLGSQLYASDLITLVTNCSNISILRLCDERSSEYFEIEGITDSTIKEIATCLPNLQDITLRVDPSQLTHVALYTLLHDCKSLQCCRLGLDIDWQAFLLQPPPPVPKLSEFGLILRRLDRSSCIPSRQIPRLNEFCRNHVKVAGGLRAVMPNTIYISIERGSTDDYEIAEAFRNIRRVNTLFYLT